MMPRISLITSLATLLLAPACIGDGGDGQEPDRGATDATPDAAGGDAAACPEGTPCDDGDPCTAADECLEDGTCQGAPLDCAGDAPCATWTCDPAAGGCVDTGVAVGWCLVAGGCAEDGTLNPENECELCAADAAQDGWSHTEYGAPCEDGNPCTHNDSCDSGVCFAGTPPSCADGLPCTADSCDPEEGCSHEPVHADCADDNPCTEDLCSPEDGGCLNLPDDELICTDLDVCTLDDHCEDGACVSAEGLACDDGNACTDELCQPVFGCVYTFNEDPCDDGAICTQDDACTWGTCVGDESWWDACPPCDINFSEHVRKVTKLAVGSGGWEGEALNIDGDLKTCSPEGSCENGLDNALSFAGELVNDSIQQNLVSPTSTLIFLVELVEPDWEGGTPFTMNMYYADLGGMNPGCDFMQDVCVYEAYDDNFDPLCNVWVSFDNAVFEDGVLTAGGSGSIFPFEWFFDGAPAELVIFNAKLEATLTVDGNGGVQDMHGVVGGAVPKEGITELVTAIDAQYFPGGQDTKDMILGLIPLMNADIDLDGDATTDGVSIGAIFDTIPGIMAPYYD